MAGRLMVGWKKYWILEKLCLYDWVNLKIQCSLIILLITVTQWTLQSQYKKKVAFLKTYKIFVSGKNIAENRNMLPKEVFGLL